MTLVYNSWPFLPYSKRSEEQTARWWDECFFAIGIGNMILKKAQWTVITGPAGCGKSTLLEMCQKFTADNTLIIDYPISQLTSGEQNHLANIMMLTSKALRQHLIDNPDKLNKLSNNQKEFFRWLIDKFNDRRAYGRWLDSIPEPQAIIYQSISFEDFYPTQSENLDVQGQIEELINLCRRIGYDQICVLADVPFYLNQYQQKQVRRLFTWLEPMQHRALRLIAAIPEEVACQLALSTSTKDRCVQYNIELTESECAKIITRYLQAATDGQIQDLQELVIPELYKKVIEMISNEFAPTAVGGWLCLAQEVLTLAANRGFPLQENCFIELRARFYANHLKLWVNEDRSQFGVWRGTQYIPIQHKKSYELLCEMYHKRGLPINHLEFQITEPYLSQTVRRAREDIEPDPANPIYIVNERGQGYRLENYRDSTY